MLNSNLRKTCDFFFGVSIFLRNTYSHLAKHKRSAEHSLGNTVLDTTCTHACTSDSTPSVTFYEVYQTAM